MKTKSEKELQSLYYNLAFIQFPLYRSLGELFTMTGKVKLLNLKFQHEK